MIVYFCLISDEGVDWFDVCMWMTIRLCSQGRHESTLRTPAFRLDTFRLRFLSTIYRGIASRTSIGRAGGYMGLLSDAKLNAETMYSLAE